MIDTNAFNDLFLKHLKKHFADAIFLTCDPNGWTRRIPHTVEELTLGHLNASASAFKGALAFSVVDGTTDDSSFLKYHFSDKPGVWADLKDRPIAEIILNIRNQGSVINTGVISANIARRPFFFLDIDMKENFEFFSKQAVLPPDALKNQASFERYLYEITWEARKSLLEQVLPAQRLASIMTPNVINFSGGGLHLWYTMPNSVLLTGDFYAALFDHMTERYHEHFPGLVFDVHSRKPNQYMRIPGYNNTKYTPPAPVQILHFVDIEPISPVLSEVLRTIPPATRKEFEQQMVDRDKKWRPSIPASTTGITGFYEAIAALESKAKSVGLKDINRDERLMRFVRENLRFQRILDYFGLPSYPGSSDGHKGFIKTNSPLREDRSPSFAYNDSSLYFKDMAREEVEGDYGELVLLILDMIKKDTKINLYDRLPSTRFEAQLHCVVIAYMTYCIDRNKKKPKFPFMYKTPRDDKPAPTPPPPAEGDAPADDAKKEPKKKPLMEVVPGKEYYEGLLKIVDRVQEIVHKNQKSPTLALTATLKSIPPVYYFYEYSFNRAESPVISTNSAIALCIIHLFHKLRPVIQRSEIQRVQHDSVVQVYLEEEGLHVPWSYYYPYAAVKSDKTTELQTRIAQVLGALGMSTIPSAKNGPSLIQRVTSIFVFLQKLEYYLGQKAQHTETINEGFVKVAISNIIEERFEGVRINPDDIKITFVDSGRWILFKNGYVLYDHDDPDRIGEFIPYDPVVASKMLSVGVVDLRIPFDYKANAPTPQFDNLINFLDSIDANKTPNLARKIIEYFLATLIYPPEGTSRAVLLYGNFGMNGKSAFADIIGALLTTTYVSKSDINRLIDKDSDKDKERAGLINKLLNISVDAPGGKIGDYFKALIVGEPLPARKMYADPIDVRFRARHLINMNTLPSMTGGDTLAVRRRFLTITLTRQIKVQDADTHLAEKVIRMEAPALWGKIIKNAKKFRKENINGFLTPDEIFMNELILLDQNDAYVFVNDFVELGSMDKLMTKNEFRRFYNDYRRVISKNELKTETIISDVEGFLRMKFQDSSAAVTRGDPGIPSEVWDTGFRYRTSKQRGLPIRIYVPPEHTKGRAIDSNETP